MEAENSQELPSASWITWEASSITEGIRNRVPDDISPSPKAWRWEANNVGPGLSLEVWEPGVQMSWVYEKVAISAQAKRAISPFLCLFVRVKPSVAWMTGEGPSSLFGLLIELPVSSGDTFTDTPRKNVLPANWASPSPVKLTGKISHRRMHLVYLFFLCQQMWYGQIFVIRILF